ncbi:MAG: hypothetical protein HND51_22150, partial [Chloroflexi bacterium]|nr:hypothetical protein [Chloroflexota bacterium]NOH14353.1 hypothetical protein [Chloroflexota bacterium]
MLLNFPKISSSRNWYRPMLLFVILAASLSLTAAQPANGLSPAPYLSPEGYLQVPDEFEGNFDLAG